MSVDRGTIVHSAQIKLEKYGEWKDPAVDEPDEIMDVYTEYDIDGNIVYEERHVTILNPASQGEDDSHGIDNSLSESS